MPGQGRPASLLPDDSGWLKLAYCSIFFCLVILRSVAATCIQVIVYLVSVFELIRLCTVTLFMYVRQLTYMYNARCWQIHKPFQSITFSQTLPSDKSSFPRSLSIELAVARSTADLPALAAFACVPREITVNVCETLCLIRVVLT